MSMWPLKISQLLRYLISCGRLVFLMLNSMSFYKTIAIFLILIFINAFLSTVGFSIANPSRLPLIPKSQNAMDIELQNWLNTHSEIKHPSELSDQERDLLISGIDESSKFILKLIQIDMEQKKEKKDEGTKTNLKSLVTSIALHLEKQLNLPAALRDPLVGHLAGMMLDSGAPQKNLFLQLVQSQPVYTCEQKSLAIASASKAEMISGGDPYIKKLLDVAAKYDSQTHRRRLLDLVASNLPIDKRPVYVANLRELGSKLPLLLRKHPWIENEDEGGNLTQNAKISISKHTKKKACALAQLEYKKYIERIPAFPEHLNEMPKQFVELGEIGSFIEQCWRSSVKVKAVQFWEDFAPSLAEKFGDLGRNHARFRVAYLHWLADENEPARKILVEVLESSKRKPAQTHLNSKALYTLGRIFESNNEIDKSLELYQQYLKDYPFGEDFEQALTSLTVVKASRQEWRSLKQILKDYLDLQSTVPLDQRPIGNNSFSLFWLGRTYVNTGDFEQARETWKRLASEYYSTFYGAMGHFLLEKADQREYDMEPTRVSSFKIDTLLRSLTEKQRDVVIRTKHLLRLGLRDEARCEADELATEDKQAWDAHLMRALLLHASGSWLDAIKIYDAIPRSVRNSLPTGFERILFPRRYSQFVSDYAKRLDLDPDLVFAVMRQESVFAKEAMSPVGAMGLMQLMPKTASLEMSKLQRPYLKPEDRQQLKSKLSNNFGLFDPELNIALGTHHLWRLMQIYKSPVFALTSYNASPAATIKWKKTIASDDLLIFIERIPYKETRAYVKLILRNYFYYKRWYPDAVVKRDRHLEGLVNDISMLNGKFGDLKPNTSVLPQNDENVP